MLTGEVILNYLLWLKWTCIPPVVWWLLFYSTVLWWECVLPWRDIRCEQIKKSHQTITVSQWWERVQNAERRCCCTSLSYHSPTHPSQKNLPPPSFLLSLVSSSNPLLPPPYFSPPLFSVPILLHSEANMDLSWDYYMFSCLFCKAKTYFWQNWEKFQPSILFSVHHLSGEAMISHF